MSKPSIQRADHVVTKQKSKRTDERKIRNHTPSSRRAWRMCQEAHTRQTDAQRRLRRMAHRALWIYNCPGWRPSMGRRDVKLRPTTPAADCRDACAAPCSCGHASQPLRVTSILSRCPAASRTGRRQRRASRPTDRRRRPRQPAARQARPEARRAGQPRRRRARPPAR